MFLEVTIINEIVYIIHKLHNPLACVCPQEKAISLHYPWNIKLFGIYAGQSFDCQDNLYSTVVYVN